MRHPAMTMTSNAMDYTKTIIPILWRFLDKPRNFSMSINIVTINGELIISVINGNRIRRFKNIGTRSVEENLSLYLRV